MAAGCAKAAAVFFDLPEPEEESQQRLPTQAYNTFVQDTGPPPLIESLVTPDSVLAVLPRDRAGYVDWVAALRDEVIRPRRTLPGVRPPMNVSSFGFDFVYEGQSPMFDAYFPHSSHTELLSCETCHPEIFPYRNSEINMAAIGRGESCGVCHRTVAFPATACERCHRQMQMPEDRVEATLGSDVVLARTSPDSSGSLTSSFPPARFPHWVHRIRYRCSACHPGLFKTRSGETPVSMEAIRQRESCGVCHNDEVAFGILQCNRCHFAESTASDSIP